MKPLKSLPSAVTGISLSLAALGNLLLPYGGAVKAACGAASAAILCTFALKLIFCFGNVKEEMINPVALSVLPTSTMALMLLCTYIKPYIGIAADALWYAAIAAHVLIMLLFVKSFVAGFKLPAVFPSWFVAGVGVAAVSVTSPAMGARPLGQAAFWFAAAMYLILLPVIIYRMRKLPLPEAARPTIAIFTAPVSLCIAGYTSAFEQPSPALVFVMLAAAVISYAYVTVSMISLLRLKFYPTCAAFTFPYVISAIAFKSANAVLASGGYGSFSAVPKAAEWAAVGIVVYVAVRYAVFLAGAGIKRVGIWMDKTPVSCFRGCNAMEISGGATIALGNGGNGRKCRRYIGLAWNTLELVLTSKARYTACYEEYRIQTNKLPKRPDRCAVGENKGVFSGKE